MTYRENFGKKQFYHVFTKSIAGYKIFNTEEDFKRIISLIDFCRYKEADTRYVFFLRNGDIKTLKTKIFELVAYCIMPTHIHLIIYPLRNGGVSKIMNRILMSYSKYFNIKRNRKGPLWEGRFKSLLIESDEQLLHLTRYIHLNPVTAYLVDRPKDWAASSYKEYLGQAKNAICDFHKYINIKRNAYIDFVLERKNYQRELGRIKHLIVDN